MSLKENANYVPDGFVTCEDDSGNVVFGSCMNVVENDCCCLVVTKDFEGTYILFMEYKQERRLSNILLASIVPTFGS